MSNLLKKCLYLTINNVKFEKQVYAVFLSSKNYSTSPDIKEQIDERQKSLQVAVIGVPNAGKSTFINNLINRRVCPTSNKVHTTTQANKAICTINHTQLVIFDTPGLVSPNEMKKHHLGTSFRSAYKHSIQNADAIAVIHDASNSWTRKELHHTVLETLEAYPKLPSCLILNKIDTLKSKRVLLDLVRTLTNNTLSARKKQSKGQGKDKIADVKEEPEKPKKIVGWSNFSDVFMVSAITGDGLQGVLNYFLSQSKPKPWLYPAQAYTDEIPENLITESVRARLLDYLPQEIPYKLKCQIEHYSETGGTIYASVQVLCPNLRIERLLCGESNGKLKQITERVTSDLVETFCKPISLTISTLVNKSSETRV